jgi:hypothetical protein
MALFKIVLRSFKIQPAVKQYPGKDTEQSCLEQKKSDHTSLRDTDTLHSIRLEDA